MRMTIAEIAEALHCATPSNPDGVITGVTWDSRDVSPGDLYVCLPGERVDGHDFAEAAVRGGATAVLATRQLDVNAAVIVVEDTMAAFTELAACWRSKLGGVVVGLTGSTGKTTTKNLVRDVLAASGSVVATLANQNNELGVPRTLLAAERDTASVVVEMGMRGLGQIDELCKIAHPDWGLISNVGESHIELLGSRDNIARAKSELLSALPSSTGIAFVNAADDYAADVCRYAKLDERGVRVVFFEGGDTWEHVDELGVFENAKPFVWATNVHLDDQGCPSFTMHAAHFGELGLAGADGECECVLALRGIHNVSNACSAAAVGLASGLTLDDCCQALGESQPERGRQQVHRTDGGLTVVDDAYNANPDSMAASLATFAAMDVPGKKVAVLGDMLELGDFARPGHERIGKLAADLHVDVLICVGELSRSMAAAAIEAGMPETHIQTCDDAAAALRIAKPIVGAGDAVLVKASHSIELELVVEGLVG